MINDEEISEAIKFSSFKNMRKMEEEDKFNSNKLRAVNKSEQESYKTRKGKVGGYKEYFEEKETEFLNKKIN